MTQSLYRVSFRSGPGLITITITYSNPIPSYLMLNKEEIGDILALIPNPHSHSLCFISVTAIEADDTWAWALLVSRNRVLNSNINILLNSSLLSSATLPPNSWYLSLSLYGHGHKFQHRLLLAFNSMFS